jgi:hypothetical protein
MEELLPNALRRKRPEPVPRQTLVQHHVGGAEENLTNKSVESTSEMRIKPEADSVQGLWKIATYEHVHQTPLTGAYYIRVHVAIQNLYVKF